MITIVLADDHQIVRQGIRNLLQTESDFKVIGDASNGLETVQITRELKPDVLILDLMMPGLNGLSVLRQVKHQSPRTHVVILSMHASEAYVVESLRAGALGYVLKDASSSELIQAIRFAHAGKRFLCGLLSERAIDTYIQKSQDTTMDPYESLSFREQEVFQLVAEGLTNSQIADRLSISPRTVESHRASLMKKLGVQNQADIFRVAVKRGILSIGNDEMTSP